MPHPVHRTYLDYAATTPVDPRVLRAMQPYFSEAFGNPGSLHSFGQEAIAAIDGSRETIARGIGAEFREIICTASATEANNLAFRGIILEHRALKKDNAAEPLRVVISAIEHESILETARDLEREGIEVVRIPVGRDGRIDTEKMKNSLNDRTVLVSLMYANNEIGAIQPVAEIAAAIQEFRVVRKTKRPLFHVDAVQAFQFFDGNVQDLGVDLMTISSHKIYGPKGAAALYRRGGVPLRPIFAGGGQEFGLRSGTENVPAIVGFAKAIELAAAAREKEAKRIAVLRDRLWQGIKKAYPKVEVNGDMGIGRALPNFLNVYFPGCAAQDLLTKFDLAGLAVSSGSACRSRAMESSYVIEALGYSKERARSSIRFSLGRPTRQKDIDAALAIIKKSVS